MSERFVRIRPCDPPAHPIEPEDRGWRLRIERAEDDDRVYIAEERTLPERVNNPDAQRIYDNKSVGFDENELRWLRDQLNELLGEVPRG